LFIPSSGRVTYLRQWDGTVAARDAEGKIIHEVQPYQALILISEAYNVKVDRILALNGLQADWPLQIGQKLLIDPGNVTPSPTPHPLSAIEQLPRPAMQLSTVSGMANTSPGCRSVRSQPGRTDGLEWS
jgi:hypothetical protein